MWELRAWDLVIATSTICTLVLTISMVILTAYTDIIRQFRGVLVMLRYFMWVILLIIFIVTSAQYLPAVVKSFLEGKCIVITWTSLHNWKMSVANFPFMSLLEVLLGYLTVALLFRLIRHLKKLTILTK